MLQQQHATGGDFPDAREGQPLPPISGAAAFTLALEGRAPASLKPFSLPDMDLQPPMLGEGGQGFADISSSERGFVPYEVGGSELPPRKRRSKELEATHLPVDEPLPLQPFSEAVARILEHGPQGAELRQWSERVAARSTGTSSSLSRTGLETEGLANLESIANAWEVGGNGLGNSGGAAALDLADEHAKNFGKAQADPWPAAFAQNDVDPASQLDRQSARGFQTGSLSGGEASARDGARGNQAPSSYGSMMPGELIELNVPPQDSEVAWTPENSIIEDGLGGLESDPAFGHRDNEKDRPDGGGDL